MSDKENQRPLCELSVPVLGDVASKYFKNLNKFQRLKEEQIEFEQTASDRVLVDNQTTKKLNKNDPIANLLVKNCQDFQSARMLLTHLGYCTNADSSSASTATATVSSVSSSNKASSSSSSSSSKTEDLLPNNPPLLPHPEMLTIDTQEAAFFEQLAVLDQLPTKTFSTSSIFYVKKSQTQAKDILANMSLPESDLDQSFYAFIHTLGMIIDVKSHHDTTTNLKAADKSKKLNKINGIDNVIHWSDISSEITFTISHHHSSGMDLKTLPSDIRVLIIWLEQMQDSDSIPVDELLQEKSDPAQSSSSSSSKQPKEIIIIFIHPLKSKLFRIITWSNINRKHFYTMPLTDGMVVSSRMLSSMVRQTVLNIFRRKRLEVDDYQPPHVRRKNKISEILKKFQSKKNEADLFTSLLMGY
jgi:hypothetical protein